MINQKTTQEISKKILLALATGALITTAMVAPGAVLIAKPFLDWQNYDRRRMRGEFKRMARQRVIEIKKDKDGEMVVKITKKGEERLLKYKFQDLRISIPKKWDGTWRIIIFDIPNEKNRARDILRKKILDLGFYKIQKSVFVCPYECENEIEFLKAILNIQQYVLIIKAKELDNEMILRQHFHLSPR